MFRLAANVVIAGSVWVLAACAGEEFTFAPPDGSGTIDAHSPEPRDASMESPEETRVDALPERFSDEASVDATLDSPPNDAMMWTPDAIEEPPPKCGAAGFVCAPAVPPGWSGPLELYSGSDAPGTRCGAHFQGPVYDGNNVLSAQVAMCDCQCQMPQAVQCSPLAASFFAGIGGTCTAVEHCGDRMLTGACQPIDVRANCVVMGMQGASMSVPAPTASGGSCMPAVTKTLPPPSWKVGGRACVSALGSAPGSCEPGYVCAPQPGAP
ncbi:MAG TPA: hypothetical protein VGY54_06825, partial [Polyangiaceae bacterium]|nr:hypothetical protein [Polyangiaceae bacterium]